MPTAKTQWKLLEWDSTFFDFPVASITKTGLDQDTLQNILSELRKKQVKLVYWRFPVSDTVSAVAARQSNGFLVDKKITYTSPMDSHIVVRAPGSAMISKYNGAVANPLMRNLAIQSGMYSRFINDSRIPKKKFRELYTIWMERSIKREIADTVLVAKTKNKIIGMVTISQKKSDSVIDLLAVDKSARGHGVGKMLIQATFNWLKKNNCSFCDVTTQETNIPACRLYESCGFKIKSQEYFYHFWL